MWATYDDIVNRWVGPSVLPDEMVVSTIIEDAEDTILREFPDLVDRIGRDEPPLTRVVKVVARMVLRHLNNPQGVRSVQQGSGPFQSSTTFGGNDPGTLALTDADRADLSVPGVSAGKAFIIDLMSRPAT